MKNKILSTKKPKTKDLKTQMVEAENGLFASINGFYHGHGTEGQEADALAKELGGE